MALVEAGGIPLLEDGARPPDADNPRGYHEYAAVARLPHDSAWLATAPGHAVKVIHALLPRLPDEGTYRVILMRRDPKAVIASQDRMLARRREGLGSLGAARLAEILEAQLEEARAWLRRRPAIAWMELDYDELLRDPGPGLARLSKFAGLSAPMEVLAAVIRPDRHPAQGR